MPNTHTNLVWCVYWDMESLIGKCRGYWDIEGLACVLGHRGFGVCIGT